MTKRTARKGGRPLGFEVLEGRRLPAGNVTATLLGDTLLIQGDQEANAIRMQGSLRVITGVPDASGVPTTVNGSGSADFSGTVINFTVSVLSQPKPFPISSLRPKESWGGVGHAEAI